jgi:ABC-2 type transport system permease protein
MIETFVFKSALADFMRLRRVLVWLLVAVALFGVAKAFVSVTDQSTQEAYVMMSSVFVFRLLALTAAIFSTAVISQEVEQKTIVYLLTRPIARWKLLLARTLAAIVAVAVISCLGAIMVSFAVFGRWHDLLNRDLVALLMGSAAYCSLFVLVSLIINRAMIVCLIFAFGWETAIPNMPGDLNWISVSSYLTSIAKRPATTGEKNLLDILGGMLGTNTIAPSTGWTVLTLLTLFCLALGAWWFTHFEYVPREDAE